MRPAATLEASQKRGNNPVAGVGVVLHSTFLVDRLGAAETPLGPMKDFPNVAAAHRDMSKTPMGAMKMSELVVEIFPRVLDSLFGTLMDKEEDCPAQRPRLRICPFSLPRPFPFPFPFPFPVVGF